MSCSIRGTVAIFVLMLSLAFFAKYSSSEPRQDIIKFLEVTGMFEGIQRGADLYVDKLRKKYPKASDEFWREVSEHEIKEYTSSLRSFYVATYSDYFTQVEIVSILEFLETPHGRKFQQLNTVLLPKFMEEATKEYQKLSESIDEKLAAMGYK